MLLPRRSIRPNRTTFSQPQTRICQNFEDPPRRIPACARTKWRRALRREPVPLAVRRDGRVRDRLRFQLRLRFRLRVELRLGGRGRNRGDGRLFPGQARLQARKDRLRLQQPIAREDELAPPAEGVEKGRLEHVPPEDVALGVVAPRVDEDGEAVLALARPPDGQRASEAGGADVEIDLEPSFAETFGELVNRGFRQRALLSPGGRQSSSSTRFAVPVSPFDTASA